MTALASEGGVGVSRGGRKADYLLSCPEASGGKSMLLWGQCFPGMEGPLGSRGKDQSMTSCYPGTVGRKTYQEMCGINYFLKESLWP